MNILTAIKNTILIFSLTFSLAQADEPGYVLQNGSGLRTLVNNALELPLLTQKVCRQNVMIYPNQLPRITNLVLTKRLMDVCNIQCAPAISTDVQTQGSNELVSTEIQFMFDRSDLTSKATRKLDSFLSAIRQRVSNIISIFGHTDSLGTDPYNDNLSERRANEVPAYLLNSGIPGREISVKGMGEGSPIAK